MLQRHTLTDVVHICIHADVVGSAVPSHPRPALTFVARSAVVCDGVQHATLLKYQHKLDAMQAEREDKLWKALAELVSHW